MNELEVGSETETVEAPETGTLPLDAWHRANGARMVEFAGYYMPIQYSGIVAEHDWTRSSAGLFDVSHMGQLTLSSDEGAEEDAATALERLLPGDIAGLKPGRMRYSLLLGDEGGVLDDLIVTNMGAAEGQALGMVVNGAMKWDDIAHLREHLPDAITLTLHDDKALLALQGPKAAAVLEDLVPGVGKLTFMKAAAFDWQGASLWISRAGYTGEDGFEISVPEDSAAAFADALIADERVKPVGLGARDSLRLEAGLPLYGHDLSPETDPVSAGLGFALSKKRRESGGWMGHGTCVSRFAEGCAERRVGLVLSGRLPAREGAAVMHGDEQVGRVTSGGFSPTLGHPVAMAYVASEHAADGTELSIDVRGKRLDARVAPMPFVPHKYYRGEA
ncbi:glycine cleavage system aminomethyltransferase GcvT [Altererythrobacter sp. SALINAS58]|uniref:glycine cleavage system aminomethyltransferase GcvT n=1 Tax=Alteripontixanthobacter muriae TaxID=2705546 RepID=UPI001575C3DF|nr:glycine cleavage system aminomethyltransferase GcvT [Alteripontixanthobacter muriae]NTZ42659.1 glycine cleavage system aminomethyltransferase GcvT [Alteripontixanthobacter muriae]